MNNEKRLDVTQVQVFPFRNGAYLGRLRGIALVELEGAIILRSLRIVEGIDGEIRVDFPADPFYRGEGDRPLVCVNEPTRRAIEEAVLARYRESA